MRCACRKPVSVRAAGHVRRRDASSTFRAPRVATPPAADSPRRPSPVARGLLGARVALPPPPPAACRSACFGGARARAGRTGVRLRTLRRRRRASHILAGGAACLSWPSHAPRGRRGETAGGGRPSDSPAARRPSRHGRARRVGGTRGASREDGRGAAGRAAGGGSSEGGAMSRSGGSGVVVAREEEAPGRGGARGRAAAPPRSRPPCGVSTRDVPRRRRGRPPGADGDCEAMTSVAGERLFDAVSSVCFATMYSTTQSHSCVVHCSGFRGPFEQKTGVRRYITPARART